MDSDKKQNRAEVPGSDERQPKKIWVKPNLIKLDTEATETGTSNQNDTQTSNAYS